MAYHKIEKDYLLLVFLEEQSFEFPKPIPLAITMQNLLVDNPEVKYFLPEKGIKFVSDNKNLNKKYTQIDGKIALCQKANQQFNWHGDFVMDKYYLSEKVKNYVLSSGTRDFYSKPAIDLSIARPLLSTMAKCIGQELIITLHEAINYDN